jgi:hypothetical protein
MARLRGAGVTIDLPQGWDGRIYRRPAEHPLRASGTGAGIASGDARATAREGTTHAVVHAANFALPPDRGDFGSGAVELMRSDDVLVMLVEYHPDAAGTALFAGEGLPRSVRADEFHPATLQRVIPGQCGVQKFFSHRGRAFCLYVVLGDHGRRGPLVRLVNSVLGTVDLDALAD